MGHQIFWTFAEDQFPGSDLFALFDPYLIFPVAGFGQTIGQRTLTIGVGKYHCTADLLFDRFGFDQTSKAYAT